MTPSNVARHFVLLAVTLSIIQTSSPATVRTVDLTSRTCTSSAPNVEDLKLALSYTTVPPENGNYFCIPTNITTGSGGMTELAEREKLYIDISGVDADNEATVTLTYESEQVITAFEDSCVHNNGAERFIELRLSNSVYHSLMDMQLVISVGESSTWIFRFYVSGLHLISADTVFPVTTEYNLESLTNGIFFIYVLIIIDGNFLSPSSENSFSVCERTSEGYSVVPEGLLTLGAASDRSCNTVEKFREIGAFYQLKLSFAQGTQFSKPRIFFVTTADVCTAEESDGEFRSDLITILPRVTVIPPSSTIKPQETATPTDRGRPVSPLDEGAIAGVIITVLLVAILAFLLVTALIFKKRILSHLRNKLGGMRAVSQRHDEEAGMGAPTENTFDSVDLSHVTLEETDNSKKVYVYSSSDDDPDTKEFTNLLCDGEDRGQLPSSTENGFPYSDGMVALIRNSRCKHFFFVYRHSPEWMRKNDEKAWQLFRDLTVRSYGPETLDKVVMIRVFDDDGQAAVEEEVKGQVLTLNVSRARLSDPSSLKQCVGMVREKAKLNLWMNKGTGDLSHSQTPPQKESPTTRDSHLQLSSLSPVFPSQPPSYTSPLPVTGDVVTSNGVDERLLAENIKQTELLSKIHKELEDKKTIDKENLMVNTKVEKHTRAMAEGHSDMKEVVEDTHDAVQELKTQAEAPDNV